LGLHKQAILKENKIILSEGHKLSLISRNGSNPFLPKTWNLKSFKITKKVGDFIKVSVVDSDKGEYNNIEINCKNKNILTIKTDGFGSDGAQNNGTTYQLGSDLIKLVTEKCSGVKKGNEGSSSSGGNYEQKKDQSLTPIPGGKNIQEFTLYGKGTTIWKKTKKGAITTKDFSSGTYKIGFLCDGYKDYDFIYAKKWFKNKELGTVLKKQFCGKKEINTLDLNSGKNEEGKDGLVANGTSGTRYSFDFETIMKAIDDTGKCPRSGSSDQTGTSGTSGVQGTSGTQGTSGVGAPVVIQKPTVTKDDFYQWTMD
jgi:hypothetical protein